MAQELVESTGWISVILVLGVLWIGVPWALMRLVEASGVARRLRSWYNSRRT